MDSGGTHLLLPPGKSVNPDVVEHLDQKLIKKNGSQSAVCNDMQ